MAPSGPCATPPGRGTGTRSAWGSVSDWMGWAKGKLIRSPGGAAADAGGANISAAQKLPWLSNAQAPTVVRPLAHTVALCCQSVELGSTRHTLECPGPMVRL